MRPWLLVCTSALLVFGTGLTSGMSLSAAPASNTLVIATTLEPRTLNPWDCCPNNAQYNFLNLMFVGLTFVDREGKLRPGLATEIPSFANGRLRVIRDDTGAFVRQEVDWTLREAATWSDGVPITCADAEFSHRTQPAPEFGVTFRAFSNLVESVRCTEEPQGRDFTIAYRLPHAFWDTPWAHGLMGFFSLAPKHIWEPIAAEVFDKVRANPADRVGIILSEFRARGSFADDPSVFVGSGAFRFESWEPGQSLRFSRREDFFLRPPGPEGNYVQEVIVRIVPNQDTLMVGLIGGQFDASDNFGLTGQDPQVLQANLGDRAVVESKPTGVIEQLSFNLFPSLKHLDSGVDCPSAEDLLLTDLRTRQAIIQAIDREALTRVVAPGAFTSNSFVTRGDLGFNPDLNPWAFNLAAARALLRGLGWSDSDGDGVLERTSEDGRVIEFRLPWLGTPDNFRALSGEILQDMLGEVGIHLELEVRPFNVFDPGVYGAVCDWGGLLQFQANGGLGMAPSDPLSLQLFANDYLERPVDAELENVRLPGNDFRGTNFSGWSNPEFDRLRAQALLELDAAKRAEVLGRMQVIYNEQLPKIPLFEQVFTLVKKAGLVNFFAGDTPLALATYWTPWLWGWRQHGAVEAP